MPIDFNTRLYEILKILEGYRDVLYTDDKGIVTTSIGVNLKTYDDAFIKLMLADPRKLVTKLNADDLDSFVTATHGKSISNLSALLAKANIIAKGTGFTLTDAEVKALYNLALPKERNKVTAATPAVTDENQLIALISLAYNGLSGLKAPVLTKDVNTENWADAWFQVRFNSNPNSLTGKNPLREQIGVARRRYYESELLGLYGPGAVTVSNATAAYQMFFDKQKIITAYDNRFFSLRNPDVPAIGLKTARPIDEELKPGYDVLHSRYDATNIAALGGTLNVEASSAGKPAMFTASRAGNYLLIGQTGQTIAGFANRANILVTQGASSVLVGGSQLNIMIADATSYTQTKVSPTASRRVAKDIFISGTANNLIIAQGTQNTFDIDNSNKNINIVYDGDGGNTFNILNENETVINLSFQAHSISQVEAYAAQLKLSWDSTHDGGLLVILNGNDDNFTVNSKRVGNQFVGGTNVKFSPQLGTVSLLEKSGAISIGSLSLYLGNHPGSQTIINSSTSVNTPVKTNVSSQISQVSPVESYTVVASQAPAEVFDKIQPGSTLIGLGGGDVFNIAAGEGSITIVEADTSSNPTNRVVFGQGISAASLVVTGNEFGDLVLDIGSGDSVTLSRALNSAVGTNGGVQSVGFADGRSFTYRDLVRAADIGTPRSSSLFGDSDANVIDSRGFAKYAQGDGGGDTFVYHAGYGALEINEADTAEAPANVLALGAGIDPAAVGVAGDANGNLILTVSDTDIITLDNGLNSLDSSTYGIQTVTFSDGTVWSYADLLSRAETGSPVTTSIYGDGAANLLDTHGQLHAVQGGGGGDAFVYDKGYGSLTINEIDTGAVPDNVLRLGAGIDPSSLGVSTDANGDLLLNLGSGDLITLQNALNSADGTIYGVQQISFADGTAWSYADLIARADTGSSSNTRLYGGTGAETFDSKGLATYEQGGGGGDTLVYKTGYGALTINERDPGSNPNNVLSFGPGIAPADLKVSGNAQGDLVLDLGNGDQVTLTGVLNGRVDEASGVQKVLFSDGTIWSATDLLGIADTGTTANTSLFGNRNTNNFDSKGYAIFEQGGGGGDNFVYNAGYGQLTINELDGGDAPDNVLTFGNGIDPTNVQIVTDAQGDVVLNVGGSDVIRLKGMAASAHAGIQAIHFANGIVWDAAQIIASANGGTLTVDPNAAEAAIGSTYYPTGSYGVLNINVAATVPQSVQTVVINGFSQSYTIGAVAGSNDILVTDSAGEGVRLVGALAAGGISVPSISFSDGTTWTYAQMAQTLLTSSLVGDSSANVLDTGGQTNFAQGGGGGDTFVFNVGYGALEIGEADSSANPANILSFGIGIEPSDVSVSADPNGSIILSLGDGDQVTLDKALNSVAGGSYGVQQVHFTDGTSWNYADLLQKLEMPIEGASGIYGDDNANILDTEGLVGFVQGGGGGDKFVYNSGYGALEISESENSNNPHNVLAFGSGIDPSQVIVTSDASGNLILSLGGGDQVTLDAALNSSNGVSYGVQQVAFADGTVWTDAQLADFADASSNEGSIIGTSGADLLDTGGTASYVQGNGGGDNFKYDRGYGALEISESDSAVAPNNVLSFGTGIDPTQIIVSSDGDGNILLDLGGSDQITLDNALRSGNGTTWGVQQVRFADGSSWSYADILAKLETATGARALDVGTTPGSVLDGGGTATYAFGKGGGDTFVYNQGYGQLTISEADHAVSPNNVLAFGSDIAPSDISVSANPDGDILLTIDDNDEVVLKNALDSSLGTTYGVKTVTFADGTCWTYAELLAQVGNGATDSAGVFGDRQTNTLDTQGLTSYAQGNGGGDTFVFNRGYGTVEINEADNAASPANILAFGAGILPSDVKVGTDASGDIVLTLSGTDQVVIDNALSSVGGVTWGVQQVTFANGTHWSMSDLLSQLAASPASTAAVGTAGPDILNASGKSYLVGHGGGDTFAYASGDGYVTIDEADTAATPDNSLVFGAGISASAVNVSGNGSGDILLSLSSTDVIVLRNALGSVNGTTSGVQQVHFSDGTSWTYADLLAKVETPSASADGIYGDAGANSLDTQGLTAYSRGGGGGDTFLYHRGYGPLEIDEADTASLPSNRLAFGGGIDPSSVAVTSDSAGNILLSLGGADEITIDNALNSGNGATYGIQQVTFEDGTSWSFADLVAKASVQASGGIYGDTGANTLDTHGLATYVQGSGGGDAFVYGLRYGALEIDEEDASANPENILVFGSGVSSSSLAVSGDGNGNLVLSLGGADQVTLDSALDSGPGVTYGVQRVTFQDGTSLSYAQLVAEAATGSARNGSIYGDGGANILDSKGLASYAAGNGGGDTFVYDSGYGALTIDEQDGAANPANVLAFGAGIVESQVTVTADTDGNLILSLGKADQVTLTNALNSGGGVSYGVQSVAFTDGTRWSYLDLIARAGTASPLSTGIYGDAGANLLDAQGLTHFAQGGGGGDTFVYKSGYGALEIAEDDYSPTPSNVLALGTGIDPSQVKVTADANGNLLLSVGGSDQITLDNALSSGDGTTYGVQAISFVNGTRWSYADLLAMADTASGNNTSLYGDANANALDSKGLASFEQGNGGGDSFIYNRGYGALTIDEVDGSASDNVIDFGNGIDPSTVAVSVDAHGNILIDLGNGDLITLKDAAPGGVAAGVLSVRFTNGQSWSAAQLAGLATGKIDFTPGTGTLALDLNADPTANVPAIDVGAGLLASDFSISAGGSSNADLILTADNGDQIILRNALTAAIAPSQVVRFSDGTSWTFAQMLSDVETGAAGRTGVYGDAASNTLDSKGYGFYSQGNGGGDTFVYNTGYGALEINEVDSATNPHNTLVFGVGIDPLQVSVTGNANSALILDLGNGDQVTLDKALVSKPGTTYGVQQVTFANGTVWSYSDLVDRASNGSADASAAYGDTRANTLDTHGYSSAEQYASYVQGGGGGDTIVYNSGYGTVEVNEVDTSANPNNVLALGAGINEDDVTASSYSSGELIVALNDGNASDQIFIDNALNSGDGKTYGVQSVRFADGTTWSWSDLVKKAETGSASNRTLYGGTGADAFDPAGWAASVQGNGGGDSVFYDIGYGVVDIDEEDKSTSPMNVLKFGADIDPSQISVWWTDSGNIGLGINEGGYYYSDQIILENALNTTSTTAYGVQEVEFANGTNWTFEDLLTQANTGSGSLIGDATANVLDTAGHIDYNRGQGYVQGGGGGDTFVFNVGYGILEIKEIDTATTPDNILQFGNGITPSQVMVSGDSSGNLLLDIGNGDQVILDSALLNGDGKTYGVQAVGFADGTSWSYQDLLGRADTPVAGGTVISGDAGANLLDTRGLVAEAIGNGGGDTFIYRIGYGDLTINESDVTGNPHNALHFGTGITASDITVTADGEGDLLLSVEGSGIITVAGGVNLNPGGPTGGVQQVTFTDGTSWTYADLMKFADTGSAANTVLYGDQRPELFDSQGYATAEYGRSGNDEFFYRVGYGNLTISESGGSSSPNSVIGFGSGITPANVSVSSNASGDMLLTVDGQGQIDVLGEFTGGGLGVQQIVFAGGGSLSVADLKNLAHIGSLNNTRLYGTNDAENFDSAGFATYISGGGGADTFAYKPGYGALEIDEQASPYTRVGAVLTFGAGIIQGDVAAHLTSGGNLVVTDGIAGDQVIIDNFGKDVFSGYGSDRYGVSSVVFSDGSSLSQQQLLGLALTPTPANGIIYGSSGDDVLSGGPNARFEDGLGGNDTYAYHAGDGALEIGNDGGNSFSGDILRFGPGIDTSNLQVRANARGDIIMTDGVAGDSITVDSMDVVNYAGYTPGLHEIDFADGSTLTARQIVAMTMIGSLTNTTIYGSPQADIIDGRGYATVEFGGGGADTFIYNPGYGQVEINEIGYFGSSATIQVGGALTAADFTASFDSSGNVTLVDGISGDQIKIDKEILYTTFFGSFGYNPYGVSSINFSDGTSITQAALMQGAVTGSPTNVRLYGVDKAETFDSRAYASYAQGVSGADTFVYQRGYGRLEINENAGSGHTNASVLAFEGSITPADLAVTGGEDGSILITDGISGDTIKLDNQLAGNPDAGSELGISAVTFTDGESLNARQLVDLANIGSATNTVIYGSAGSDVIDGKGYTTAEYGNGGGDTFVYGKGYGTLVINERELNDTENTLQLNSDIGTGDVTLSINGDSVVLELSDGGRVQLTGQLQSYSSGELDGVEAIKFSDGTVWDRAEIARRAGGSTDNGIPGGPMITPSAPISANVSKLPGVSGSNLLDMANGVIAFTDSDVADTHTSVIDGVTITGDDSDAIDPNLAVSWLSLGVGQEPSLTASGQLNWTFTAPDKSFDSLGTNETSVLTYHVTISDGQGRSVSDDIVVNVMGAGVSSTLVNAGDMSTTVDDNGAAATTFIAGKGDDHFVGRDGVDTYVYASADGNILVEDYSYSSSSVDTLRLTDLNASDVTFYTDRSQGEDAYIRINATGKVIRLARQFNSGDGSPGWGIEQVVFADGETWGRQQIREASWFYAGNTDVRLDGYDNVKNTLVAGPGNDHLVGYNGPDTYMYASGDGNLLIEDYSTSGTSIDTLKLTDLNASDVTFYTDRSQGDDAYIRINATGKVIRLARQFNSGNGSPGWGIEQVAFADGTTWGRQQIQDAAWFYAGAVDTRLDGYDYVNNTLVAGSGNDHLVGYNGSDTYRYAKTDGNLEVEDYSTSSTAIDTLKLTDLNASDVTFYADQSQGNDVYIRVNATGNTIRLDRQNSNADNGPDWGIEQVVFADGTTMDRQQIRDAAWFRLGDGNQTVYGYGWNNTFVAGAGNDHVRGYDGSDTYFYTSTAGNFDVEDYSNTGSSVDTLKLTDLNASDVTIYADQSQGNDVYIRVNATGNTIRLDRQNSNDDNGPDWGVEQVVFADGTTMDRQQIRDAAWFRLGAGNQNIDGYAWNNTFVAGAGNDHVRGHDGSDTYLYTSTAGNFDVEDYSNTGSSVDTLKLTDLNAADVTFYADQSQGNDVYIRVNATGNVIRLDRQNSNDDNAPDWGVEQVVFADGTTMDRQQIRDAAWFRVGGGNQNIDGYAWNNTFVAGAGNNHVRGHDGSDTYVYASTAGNFDLEDYSNTGSSVDKLKLTDLNASDVTFYADRSQGEDVYIRVNATGNVIRLDRQNSNDDNGPDWGVEQVMFADGTTMDRQQIRDAAWFRLGDGNQNIDGYAWNSTFVAGAGNDHVRGHDGSDTYVYSSTAGNFDLEDYSNTGSSVDKLKLTDLNASDVTFYADRSQGEDVYIRVNATGNVIRLDRQNSNDNNGPDWGVEQVMFADGTTMDRQQIRDAAWFRLGDGNQNIDGYAWNSTFVAGAGNDHVRGHDGSDTYVYSSTAGNFDLEDYSTSSTSIDVLKFTDLNAADLLFSASGDNASITVKSTGKTITLERQMDHDGSSPGWGVDQVQFGDGSTWDRARLVAELTAQQGTGGDDQIDVASGGEVYGNGGNDTIVGSGAGTAAYSGDSSTYSVTKSASGSYLVYDGVSGRDGLDEIWDLDTLQFKDTHIRFADRLEGWIGNAPSISEKAPAGTVVGTVQAYRGPLFTDGVVYSLDAASLTNFNIDAATGVITIAPGATLNAATNPLELVKVSADFGSIIRVIPLTISLSSLTGTEALGVEKAPIQSIHGSTSDLGNSNYQLTPDEQNKAGNIVGTVDLSTDVVWTTRMYFGARDDGADGVSFALSGVDQQPQDVGGGSLGTLDSHSFGFKIDTHSNREKGDPSSDFGQFVLDGNVSSSSNNFDNYHLLTNVEDGNWHDVTITWQAATHTLSYALNGALIEQKSYDVIGSTLSGATQSYFSFGAATGSYTDDQRVQVISVAQQNDELSVDVGSGGGTLVATLRPSGVNVSGASYQITDQNGNNATDTLFNISDGNNIRVNEGVTVSDDGAGVHNLFVKTTDNAGESIVSNLAINLRTVGGSYDVTTASDLTGGIGSDLFSVRPGFGSAAIENFDATSGSHDVLAISRNAFEDWSHLLGATRQVGSDLIITVTNDDTLTLKNVALSSFRAADIHFT